MPDQLIIRPLAAGDEAAWRELWKAYLAFYETELPEEVYQTAFGRLLAETLGEFQGLIAELAGRPVGLAHFVYHRFLWSIEDTCYLMDLFADPDLRGQGIGRALIEGVYERAKADGIATVYWQTQEFNYKGRMLYDQVANRTPFIVYEKDLGS
ncbi:MAG: GNAT family N-acetyltransferase [Pseudomonadota bacterium]